MGVRPTTDELLSAVSGFIEGVQGALKDRDAFLARVALNAVALIRRELADAGASDAAAHRRLVDLLGEEGDLDALNARLCARIRAGDFDDAPAALEAHLVRTVLAQTAIDQPGYSGLRVARARLTALDEPERE